MAYSINPNLPRARAIAMKLLIAEGLSLNVVANKCGVHRSTIWRWLRKWRELNKFIQWDNPNRPSRLASPAARLARCKWKLPTIPSRPHTSPNAISSEVIRLVLATRNKLNRCAEVVHHYLVNKLLVIISLSSVKRIFRRHHIYERIGLHGRHLPRPYRKGLARPPVLAPGDLVQTDTVHLVHSSTYRRLYVYTVIDLFTRLAHAEVHSKLSPGLAARAVLNAKDRFGFSFNMAQADNGPEYSSYFEHRLHGQAILTRHSRLHRPNDNAFIERFNRTIQEECTSPYYKLNQTIGSLQAKIDKYLDYYNNDRVHLGLQLRTPAEMLANYAS